ncbi:hypothetical protein [Vagococcus fluvialis]|uniref:hypothetical protein n=1 Tax=Vagococcus fluvialis TaxID=2738 RepID=UPI0020331DD7|nr:hypothetical protein [Vagococcus fluvialis]MCM2138930.1 hypothetical protein [Vagococcus fluvialis]
MVKILNDNNIFSLVEVITTILLAIATGILASKITLKPEKQITARMMFDKSFSKIFYLTEPYLFSKEITLKQVNDLGNQIHEICNNSEGYYHPSIKSYARRLAKAYEGNYKEEWEYFSERFSMRYDKICLSIGVPLRNSAYRVNYRQYHSNAKFWWLIFKNDWFAFLIYLLMIIFVFYLFKFQN